MISGHNARLSATPLLISFEDVQSLQPSINQADGEQHYARQTPENLKLDPILASPGDKAEELTLAARACPCTGQILDTAVFPIGPLPAIINDSKSPTSGKPTSQSFGTALTMT
jgi:hypothetical protein